MNTDAPRDDDQLTRQVIGAAYEVSNTLGVGFLEKVYENALAHQLRKTGLEVAQQVPVRVYFDGVVVGDYYVDLLVYGELIVELKHVADLCEAHLAQCLNYLKATRRRLALIINFGQSRVQVRRVVRD